MSAAQHASPVEDLDKYARANDDDDYRHRMKTNAIALAFVALLVVCGLWLADTMARIRQSQDCVLSGRQGCAQLNIDLKSR